MSNEYDVIIIGGGYCGSASALLLKRWMPDARVLIVERRESFDRKVGEATVEMSAMFLHRVLKLYDYVSREHLPKHGLRFWFHKNQDDTLQNMSEVGPSAVSPLPSFQLDRSRLDGALLCEAVGAGAELMQPATIRDVDLGWPRSNVVVTDEQGGERKLQSRWVIDASGRNCFLSRRLDLLETTDEHPTQAAWGRWRGVKDLDGVEVSGNNLTSPTLPPVNASRRLATNHFTGYGYWIWVIPLIGGETSIGVVFDKRIFQWPDEGRPSEQYHSFLKRVPGLRDLIQDAQLEEGDFRGYGQLAYRSKKFMDRGWSLLGDAGAFLDPFYSPGLDYCSFSLYSTARVIEADLAGSLSEDALDRKIAEHDGKFLRSYPRWFEALYKDKYEILGDAELTTASFLFDTGMYYLGVVGPAVRNVEEFCNPVLGLDAKRAVFAYKTMDFFRRRMVRLARFKRACGTYGRRNTNWKFYPRRFGLGLAAFRMVMGGARIWLRGEVEALLWRIRHGRVDCSAPVSAEEKAPVVHKPIVEPAPASV